jgi:hypothetical protein
MIEGLRQDLEECVQFNRLLRCTVCDMLSMMDSMRQNAEGVLALQPKLNYSELGLDGLTTQSSADNR